MPTDEKVDEVGTMLDGLSNPDALEAKDGEKKGEQLELDPDDGHSSEKDEGTNDESDEGDEGEDERSQSREVLELRAQLAELQATTATLLASQSSKPTKEETIADEIDFIGDAEVDEIFSNKKSFNDLLNKVYKTGAQKGMQLGVEKTLSTLPNIVGNVVEQKVTVQNAVSAFYTENPDLKPYSKAVGAIANEIATKNPNLGITDLFAQAEKVARERLRLTKKAQKTAKEEGGSGKPSFGRSPSARRSEKPAASGEQADIEKVINAVLGR